MDFSKLKSINEEKAQAANQQREKAEDQLSALQLQETIVKSFKALVDYLDGRTSKTVVVNQLEKIATPDAQKVVEAVNSLHETQKTHKNVDITPLTEVMGKSLKELKAIPKTHAKPEKQKFIDYSKPLASLEKSIKDVVKAVNAQETHVEAPVVNVPEPVVNVEAPNLNPLNKTIEDSTAKTTQAVENLTKEDIKVEHTNVLISEKFDEWRAILDEFDEEEPIMTGICYYYKRKKVAELCYTLKDGMIVGVKKVKV